MANNTINKNRKSKIQAEWNNVSTSCQTCGVRSAQEKNLREKDRDRDGVVIACKHKLHERIRCYVMIFLSCHQNRSNLDFYNVFFYTVSSIGLKDSFLKTEIMSYSSLYPQIQYKVWQSKHVLYEQINMWIEYRIRSETKFYRILIFK